MVISPLKETPAIMDEWMRNTSDIGSNSYDATLVDVISKRFLKKNQMSDALIVVSKVFWKGIVGKTFLEKNVFFFQEIIHNEGPSLPKHAESLEKPLD